MVLTTRKRWGVIAGFAAVVLALMLAVGPHAGGASTNRFGGGGKVSQIQDIQPEEQKQFAVFQRAHGITDDMPPSVAKLLGESDITGKNLALARRFATADGSGWAIPGNGSVCIALPDRLGLLGLSCSSSEDAAAHGAIAMMIGPDEPARVLLGLVVPHGAAVVAQFKDGRTQALRDVDGVVSTALTAADAVELTTRSGQVTRYPIPTPPPIPSPQK